MKTKYGETLVTDMEDAQLLLSYVTRNGLHDLRMEQMLQGFVVRHFHRVLL